MLSFFDPAYIKEARLVLKNARKLLHYKQDVLPAEKRAEFDATIAQLEKAIRDRDKAAVEAAVETLDRQWNGYLPSGSDAGWRENCEVFLVAIVIAIGVRTFFIQPFTIPTGSMQPTLNGIIGTPSKEPAPNLLMQAFELVARGRNYINAVSKTDDTLIGLNEHKLLYFFTLTDIQCVHYSYTVWAPWRTLVESFGLTNGQTFHAGDVIVRGTIDAGDHVFVDKVSYNLRQPNRGDIIVFSTRGIPRLDAEQRKNGQEGSEFYIKRLAGVPGDTLRIEDPLLFVNGTEAKEFGLQRVMKMQGPHYDGYSNPHVLDPLHPYGALNLTNSDQTYSVPPGGFFALGDNSRNSLDSRYWGTLPQDNMMGRGLFVYWPFLPHWGFVK